MRDGSAVLAAEHGREAHALNAEAAALWTSCAVWTVAEVSEQLRALGHCEAAITGRAQAFISQLVELGLLEVRCG